MSGAGAGGEAEAGLCAGLSYIYICMLTGLHERGVVYKPLSLSLFNVIRLWILINFLCVLGE